MHRNILPVTAAILVYAACAAGALAETVTTHWGGDAGMVYDTGFMRMLMKHENGGVCLFNIDLLENDGPGAGGSEKGVRSDIVWGSQRARKVFYLEDPRAHAAYLVAFFYRQGKYPLKFTVNDNLAQFDTWDIKKCPEMYRWTAFPGEWLKKGKNTIDLFCPEAASEDEGWELYIARADEFENGGGDPANVGKTSFKSTNGGESWKESPFGPLGETRAEYSIRLSLDRCVHEGWLASPVVDLWSGDSDDVIVPLREIQSMKLSVRADVPKGTAVKYYFRKGTEPNPHADTWEPYMPVGEGPVLDFETGGAALNRRYVQFKAILSTSNPLVSPVIQSMHVTAELNQRVPQPANVHVIEADNPAIGYSSIDWEWEKWDRPEFAELRERENIDEVVRGSRTDFDAQVKILDYVAKRWQWSMPARDFPAWDALSVLGRLESLGAGGNCITFNNTIGGICMSYGWQARLVNVVGHEVIEVWNDDYGKWVMLDGAFDPENENTYQYDPETAEPLNMLELHRRYLDYYFPRKTIDWMKDYTHYQNPIEGKPVPVGRGSLTPEKSSRHTGFICAAFMRMVPRNNWYEKPCPRPLNHGTTWWPWNGYVNWYDGQTPPKRQYSWHTDRPRDMWPDLNLVHIDAVSGFGNDRLFLRFETYTPNFSHFEADVDGSGWKKVGDRWTWLLQSGRNTLRVRAVNKLGARGRPSTIVLNHADAPFGQ